MGLREDVRARLLPEELNERERARLEERHLEQKIRLRTEYSKARRLLLILTILTVATILLVPRMYKLSFPFAVQMSQLLMAYGYQGHMVVGFGLALLVAGVYLLLWWLSGRHYGWIIAAAALFFVDLSSSFLMLSVTNYDSVLLQQSAGLDVAAGVPGMGAASSDYITTFILAVFVHVVVVGYLIYGAVKGAQMRRVPEVSIEERQVEKTVYHEDQDYTEHPEESTLPLRDAEPESTVLIRRKVQNMQVEVSRAYGVTALVVDGKVYNDQKGTVEPRYHLGAFVGGVHLLADHVPMEKYSLMTLYADGVEIGCKKRYV